MSGLAALIIVAAYVQWAGAPPSGPLPALETDLAATSVSGLSAGAYMAAQFHIAHSKSVIGAGLVAGGPYGCADSPTARLLPWPASVPQNLARALSRCMGSGAGLGVPDVATLVERARALAGRGAIDPLDGMADDHIYLFWGGFDHIVGRAVVEAAKGFYEQAGMPADQIAFLQNAAAGHAFLTTDVGNPCDTSRSPYVNDCDYDQAGGILAQLYGLIGPPPPERAGALVLFDQRPFTQGLASHGLDDYGYVYIPAQCRARAGCRVHVVFHGCEQSREAVGDRFVRNAGFAPYADSNRLVILYPQVAPSVANPKGCWDWWGYSARDYLTKDAPQIAAVWRMLRHLAGTQ